MHSYRFLFRAPLLVLFTLLIACEDPSNVGLGLVGGEGGEPVVEELALSSADAVPGTGIRDNTPQHLVGQVDDPVMGQFNATAYIDFLSNTTLDEGYRNGPIDRVFLRLQRFYVYGDTTQEMTVALHESLREFSAVGSTPDSIPAVGPEIMQFSFMPMDSIVSVQLPAAWVEAKDADLRSSSFGSLFNGFQLVPISGNAIVGFRNSTASQSTIRGYVETDDETFQEDYLAAKSITQFTRERSAEAPPGIMIIQNGVGPRLRLNFDLSQLQDVSLNRTVLHFATDSLALAASPNFVRTFQDNMALYGVFGDTTSVLLAINPIGSDGKLDLVSETLRSVLQQFVLGVASYDYYELRFPTTSDNTVNLMAFQDSTSVDEPPSLVLTFTSLQ